MTKDKDAFNATEFSDIEAMILNKVDEKDVVLLILNKLTMAIVEMKESSYSHHRRITDTEGRISAHNDIVIQGKTMWKVLSFAFLGVSTIVGVAIPYGYNKIANMDKQLIELAVVVPRLEGVKLNALSQSLEITDTKTNLEQQQKNIENQLREINSMKRKIDDVTSTKVFKAAKR